MGRDFNFPILFSFPVRVRDSFWIFYGMFYIRMFISNPQCNSPFLPLQSNTTWNSLLFYQFCKFLRYIWFSISYGSFWSIFKRIWQESKIFLINYFHWVKLIKDLNLPPKTFIQNLLTSAPLISIKSFRFPLLLSVYLVSYDNFSILKSKLFN